MADDLHAESTFIGQNANPFAEANQSLSELMSIGCRASSAVKYKERLKQVFNKCDWSQQYSFEDPRWMQEKKTILEFLDTLSPSRQSAFVTAIRGTLKPIQLYHVWEDESNHLIERPEGVPQQKYTAREKANEVPTKDIKELKHDHYDPKIKALLKRGRECRAQSGFPATPFLLTPADRIDIMEHLTLSLYSQMAPCRNELADLEIINGETGNPFVTYPKNYILCPNPEERPVPRYILHLSDYKTSDTYHQTVRSLPACVNQDVYDSLRLWNRKYLICKLRDGERPMGRDYFSGFFSDINQRHFGNKAGSTNARKSYATLKFGKDASYAKRAELARDMMHSVNTQTAHYIKKA